MSVNRFIQGFWISAIVLGCIMTAVGESEGRNLWFYLGGWIVILAFIGWLKTHHIDGWLGTSPEDLAEQIQFIEEELNKGTSINGKTLTNAQKEHMAAQKAQYEQLLSQAKALGHYPPGSA